MRIGNCAWKLACGLFWGCAPVPAPCLAADACGPGEECLAHRCVAQGSEPVAENGQRLVAELTEIGVIAANADYSQGLPGALTFGARRTGAFEVLLRFDPVWRGPTEFEQAFLLFEPAPGTHASAGTTPVAVWRIDEPWNRDELSWRAQPELTLPKVEGLASANGSPLRLDVTPLIQYLKRHPEHDHGMAVRAQASDGLGVSYASGVLGGTPPYVEVYSR